MQNSFFQNTVPEVKAILPELTELVISEFGDRLDKVILIGSALDTEKFLPGVSDVDVAILIKDGMDADGVPGLKSIYFPDMANEMFKGPWTKINPSVHRRAGVERLRNFELCYEGQVVKGRVLYDSGVEWAGEVLSREEARKAIVDRYMRQAGWWIKGTHHNLDNAIWSSCRSVCRALHSILVSHDFDFSHREMRWNLPVLFDQTLKFYPELEERIGKFVRMLPPNEAQKGIDEMGDDYDDEEDLEDEERKERRKCMAAAIRCVRGCRRLGTVRV